jgi:glycerol 3-phosphatase-1
MGSVSNSGNFKAPAEQVTFDGLLFDMDGTIIDSTEAVEKHWHTYDETVLTPSRLRGLTQVTLQDRPGDRG